MAVSLSSMVLHRNLCFGVLICIFQTHLSFEIGLLPRIDRSVKGSGMFRSNRKHTSNSNELKPQISTEPGTVGKYEIRTVSGEPNYKSVNLTWEVEFVPSATTNNVNESAAIQSSLLASMSPKAFQIFFCEMQSFGPHRCRSKVIDDDYYADKDDDDGDKSNATDQENDESIRVYSAKIDNLRMATRYSFHIRPQVKKRNLKITGRSEIFDNEIDTDGGGGYNGQTIVIPTKGFSAQATKCLPQASEIEVETGPNFGGKIAVDGGNCGIKGNPKDSIDKYVMRIDHKKCGSLVKAETNTVETFITVQENLGIFTHSTRRFVVVCSFQSGMQTVRASFTVPGKDGVAAPVGNDPFQPDRLGREQRHLRYVDKSGLVLKEESSSDSTAANESESEALVTEIKAPSAAPPVEVDINNDADVTDSVAIIEDIIPGVNEDNIRHLGINNNPVYDSKPVAHAHRATVIVESGEDVQKVDKVFVFGNGVVPNYQRHDISNSFQMNLANLTLTISLSVIMIGIFIFVLVRESRRKITLKSNSLQQKNHKPSQVQ